MSAAAPRVNALLALSVLLSPATLPACSSVVMVMNGKVLLGNHNDNSYKLNMLLHVTPNRDGLFGRICVSMETVPGWVPMGMKCVNEMGLAITHANVPQSDTPYDPDKPEFQHNFLEKIVAECRTVKQAVSMLRAYSLPPAPHLAHVHLMLADATGDTAIVEWVDGEAKAIRRSGSTQIMANSLISKPRPTDGPNNRQHRGERMLAEVKEASVASMISVLKEISVHGRYKGDEVGTVESAIFDLTGGKVHLYYKRDFDHPLTLDLQEEIAKGPRTVEFKSLFPNPVPFEPGNRYEDGPVALKVSSLHTVSVHVDSPETYNSLLQFFEKDLQWPVIYGKPWTPGQQRQRSYAGIWAGNVVLEICGPYTGETFAEGVRARLHGLTFRPDQTTEESIAILDRERFLHKPPFGSLEGGSRFVVLDDPALTSPTLAVSIMQVGDRNREKTGQDAARAALIGSNGGPLGLRSVQEIRVAYKDASSLARWREFLTPDYPNTGAGPSLRFEEAPRAALTALVLRVASASKAKAFLETIGSDKILTAGVRIICVE